MSSPKTVVSGIIKIVGIAVIAAGFIGAILIFAVVSRYAGYNDSLRGSAFLFALYVFAGAFVQGILLMAFAEVIDQLARINARMESDGFSLARNGPYAGGFAPQPAAAAAPSMPAPYAAQTLAAGLTGTGTAGEATAAPSMPAPYAAQTLAVGLTGTGVAGEATAAPSPYSAQTLAADLTGTGAAGGAAALLVPPGSSLLPDEGICSVCGQKQKISRSICFQCGVRFLPEQEVSPQG